MKLLIFGATGTIGREVVRQALARDFQVTAMVRSAAALEPQSGLTVVTGDVLNPDDVERAFDRPDAVICTLGAGARGTVRSTGTRNIVQAMVAHDVRRLICLSTLGAGDSRVHLDFFWKYIMFGLLLRRAYADHQQQEACVMASSLDWTLVRPGAFADGPLTRQFRRVSESKETDLALKISRADVAWFILEQLTSTEYLHRAAGITY